MEESRSVTPWVNRLYFESPRVSSFLGLRLVKARHTNLVPLLSGVKPHPRVGSGMYAEPIPVKCPITQGRQAITEPRGRHRVHNFSKPVKHKQKHRNRRISAQNVKDVLNFTPITVSLPGNAVLRHNCTQKFHLARNPRIPNVFRTSNLPVSINVICSRGITTSGTRSFPKS